MMPLAVTDHQAPVPPPSYQRGQARLGPALHIDALTLVTTLHLLALCQLAVRLAHRRCPPPLRGTGQEALHEPTAKKRSCSLTSCAPFGGSPIRICTSG